MGTVIRTEGLSKSFGSVHALAGLDLEVTQGEVLGYLGPNGAGKTTTLRLLMGLLRPTAGRAEIFGLDIENDAVAAHRRVAYVPGEANLHITRAPAEDPRWGMAAVLVAIGLVAALLGMATFARRDLEAA